MNLWFVEPDPDRAGAAFQRDLLAAMRVPRGLVLVAAPGGHGKTTAIRLALADPACPPDVLFMGDLRSSEAERRAIDAARAHVVVAVLRIPRACGVFGRLIDRTLPADVVAATCHDVFTTALFYPPDHVPLLLHERIVVTDAIRSLIMAGADEDAIQRCAIAEGMTSLRQVALEHARAGHFTLEDATSMTWHD